MNTKISKDFKKLKNTLNLLKIDIYDFEYCMKIIDNEYYRKIYKKYIYNNINNLTS